MYDIDIHIHSGVVRRVGRGIGIRVGSDVASEFECWDDGEVGLYVGCEVILGTESNSVDMTKDEGI